MISSLEIPRVRMVKGRKGQRIRMEIISEMGYRDRMEKEAVPFLKEHRYCGFFAPDGQGDIYYERYRQEKAGGTVVMVHGFSESAEKYAEMIYYFLQAGYQVYIMDVRGHGRSVRSREDLSMVHIDRYERYLSDLEYLAAEIAAKENPALPLYLYGHSMGGGIAAAFLEKSPGTFRKAVLSSPMIRPLTGGIPFGAAYGIADMQCRLGKGGCYVVGHHAFAGDETFESSASVSAERYEYYARKRQSEEKFQTNGASYSWLREAARMSKYILKEVNCRKITAEVLLFQAEREEYVDKKAQEKFVSRVESARLVPMAGTKHEIYMSDDGHVVQYLDEILKFFGEGKALQ